MTKWSVYSDPVTFINFRWHFNNTGTLIVRTRKCKLDSEYKCSRSVQVTVAALTSVSTDVSTVAPPLCRRGEPGRRTQAHDSQGTIASSRIHVVRPSTKISRYDE